MKDTAASDTFVDMNAPAPSGDLDQATALEIIFPEAKGAVGTDGWLRQGMWNGSETELKTVSGPIFRFNDGALPKATIIIYTTDNEGLDDCHTCFPETGVASLRFEDGQWRLQKFIRKWKDATGSWGEPAAITIDSAGSDKYLLMSSAYSDQGHFEARKEYFNMETFELVKRIVDTTGSDEP